MAGLMSLVIKHLHIKPLFILTACFYSLLGFIVVIAILVLLLNRDLDGERVGISLFSLGMVVSLFVVLSALYSDWALGLMTGKIAGLPSGDSSAFYWTYWFAKRLSMFSW